MKMNQMDIGIDNTKLEELMKDPEKEGELIEELKKSQLFLPVIYPENSFDIEGAKVGDVIQGPSGFNINYLTENNGNKAIPLFTSDKIMDKVGLRSSTIVMYVPDLANILRGAEKNYEYVTINPLAENGVDMATITFLNLFSDDYEP